VTTPTDDALLRALDKAGGHRILTAAVAWTWLEQHLQSLGALLKKPHVIRAEALNRPAFAGWDQAERDHVEANPLVGAAELLVRIHQHLRHNVAPTFAVPAISFDDDKVIVVWKAPALAVWRGSEGPSVQAAYAKGPPATVQHPSVATFAPRLTVCPRWMHGIELSVERPTLRLPGWRAAWKQLHRGLIGPAHNEFEPDAAGSAADLSVHLDALGADGQSGWTEDPDPALALGWFDESAIDPDDERRCGDEATRAVACAAGSPTVLVMPELVATTRIEQRIVTALATTRSAPALTVVGRYHRRVPAGEPPPPGVPADAVLARRVNEAIVLGPDGKLLWRHRKFTAAQDRPNDAVDDGELPVAEDNRVGRVLQIVPSPLGMVAVVVCLDSFTDHVRARIEHGGADVLLVPSLSPHVKRHRASLQHLVQALWGIAFVCNRAFRPPDEGQDREKRGEEPPAESVWNEPKNRSFWAIQREEPCDATPCSRSRTCFAFEPAASRRRTTGVQG
jgi:predicted amidohydrolase